MDCNAVKRGMRVKTGYLGNTVGYMVGERHIHVRASNVTGTVGGWVPGHGGDVWYVYHDLTDEERMQGKQPEVGVYMYTEFEPLDEPDGGAHE